MGESKCPVCGSKTFHVKHPDDQYDIYEFECRDGEVRFQEDLADEDCPPIDDSTETYCNTCAWHDKFDKLKKY
jgi:hypothetical protein